MTEKPLQAGATLFDVVRAIEQSRRRIAVVVDGEGRLLGTLTDGDVRRSLLAGGDMKTPAIDAMNSRPVSAPDGSPSGYLLDLMKGANVLAVPTVDAGGRFVRLMHLTDLDGDLAPAEKQGFVAAVIMAGGEGTRLRPLTYSLPKPMVDIGGIPLLERQVRRLAAAGIARCFISVNYLSGVIEDHFADGKPFGIRIEYLRERQKMGTAGALSLLPALPAGPIIVMNGDIVTTSDFDSLYAYHVSHDALVTVAAIDYRVQIPFGVIRSEGALVSDLEEKPSQRFLCNAGIYALAPQALALLRDGPCNMTDLIRDCLAASRPVAVFPMHEFWSDIGTPDDLERARAAFSSMTAPRE
jgi:dTDP-glucose pyrophosphorylase